MNRRAVLSWLGLSAAAVTTPAALSASTRWRPDAETGVLTLERFRAGHPDQARQVHDYLTKVVVPATRRGSERLHLLLEAIVAPRTPEAVLLTGFSSFDEMLALRRELASNPDVRRARARLESGEVPVLSEVESHVMLTQTAAWSSRNSSNEVVEIRSYQAAGWHDGVPTELNEIYDRAGIRPLIHASTTASEHLPRFTFVIPFESLAVRQDAWARFEADPEWLALQRTAAARHGVEARVTGKALYTYIARTAAV